MKKHKIDIKDFEGFFVRQTIAASNGPKEDKRIIVVVNVMDNSFEYVVYDGGELYASCSDIQTAVSIYNGL
jgi:uncharacterized DUF497 family protein